MNALYCVEVTGCREIKLCIPNAQSINRGNYRVDELVEACRKANFSDIVILNETRGQPDGLIVCHLPFGPTAYFTLSNAVLRHDIPECTPASQAYPHLILDNFTSSLGARASRILQVAVFCFAIIIAAPNYYYYYYYYCCCLYYYYYYHSSATDSSL